jgi:hypothetical protein
MRGLFFQGCGVYRYSIASSFIHGVSSRCTDQSGSNTCESLDPLGSAFPILFFDRVNLALRHCESTANGSALGFDPLGVGNSLLQLHFVYAKEISQPRKSTAMSDATQRLLQPFPNLFSFQLIPRYECNDQLSPQPFRLPLPMRLQSTMIEPSIVGMGKL